jgi:hypothetical protein
MYFRLTGDKISVDDVTSFLHTFTFSRQQERPFFKKDEFGYYYFTDDIFTMLTASLAKPYQSQLKLLESSNKEKTKIITDMRKYSKKLELSQIVSLNLDEVIPPKNSSSKYNHRWLACQLLHYEMLPAFLIIVNDNRVYDYELSSSLFIAYNSNLAEMMKTIKYITDSKKLENMKNENPDSWPNDLKKYFRGIIMNKSLDRNQMFSPASGVTHQNIESAG